MTNGVAFNRGPKFDLQLSQSVIHERRLAEIFANLRIEKLELKTETWLWERTGNICIEFRQRGKPSGIAITEADVWVHELRRDDQTLVYLMFPTERLKELCRLAYRKHAKRGGGDGGEFDNIVLPLREILKGIFA